MGGVMEADGRKDGDTPAAAAQRGEASLGVSVQEGLQHAKASVVGAVQQAMAGSEEEAAQADLRAAKAQVEATDEAEVKKKQLAAG
ncbi:uncharacterized protein LOC125521392 [Triticum urartu]|uniref:uncharacterized protein LOC125521346 n=1 Tax=Triticum urartu TaxID=4572 RepID=UPI0020436CEE|nr:uncharacterized protein LOC125521346 [Triticum urartu]XP_048542408.1 uncharacterized protein LOC125521392 [Triticum urartu]